MNRFINTEKAAPPPPTARYSHAVEAGGVLYVTGQLPVDAAAPEAPLPEEIEAQTEMVFVNLGQIVEAAGYRMADAVFVRVFLTDFDGDYERFNAVYRRYFDSDDTAPGRTTVGVTRLARNARIEIDMILKRQE